MRTGGTDTIDHDVYFYSRLNDLHGMLQDYLSEGLAKGETCLVIATPAHRKEWLRRLKKQHDVSDAVASGQLITLDAADTLQMIMRDGMPNRELFMRHIRSVLDMATGRGARLRAYGEMVALLWQEGNKQGMLHLEEWWNQLGEQYTFSMLCMYPKLHFCMDSHVMNELDAAHQHADLITA